MRILSIIEDVFGVAIMTLLVIFVCIQIGARWFAVSIVWTETLVTLLFMWVLFIGSAAAMRKGEHVRITLLEDMLPSAIAIWLQRLIHLVVIAYLIVLANASFQLAQGQWVRRLSTLDLPQGIMTVPVVVGCALMAIHGVCALFARTQKT